MASSEEPYPYSNTPEYPAAPIQQPQNNQDVTPKKKKKNHDIMIVMLILLIVAIIGFIIGFIIVWNRWIKFDPKTD